MSNQHKLLYFDAELCVGCHSCEIACKVEHNLPVGVNRVHIVTEGPNITKGGLQLGFKQVRCMQCPNPPCIRVCPTEAIKKRSDGIVTIDKSLCTGCQACAEACPYNAISFHPENSMAEKCDLCAERLDQGLLPFCLKHCMGSALFFGTSAEYRKRKQQIKTES